MEITITLDDDDELMLEELIEEYRPLFETKESMIRYLIFDKHDQVRCKKYQEKQDQGY